MICLLISLILMILKLAGVIAWSWWIVAAPAGLVAIYSYWLLVKTEFIYMRDYNKALKEEQAE